MWTASGCALRWKSLHLPYFLLLDFLLLYHFCVCGADSHGWSYNENQGNGPSNWAKRYPTCGGHFQSPLDIRRAKNSGNLTSLVLEGYEKILKSAVLVNNGHSVQLSSSDSRASLTGGCLRTDKYDFAQLHFHWGSNDSVGSEHTFMGKPFPMEGHFVHINRKYGRLAEALKYQDGLAVLAVFYRSTSITTDVLNALIEAVKVASQVDLYEKIKVEQSLTLRALLPKEMSRFYCYERGSLTTPSCDESVTWTIMEDSVPLSREQVAQFRKLRFEDGTAMVDNFRPVQQLHGRTIYFRGAFSSAAPEGRRLDFHKPLTLFLCGCYSVLWLSPQI